MAKRAGLDGRAAEVQARSFVVPLIVGASAGGGGGGDDGDSTVSAELAERGGGDDEGTSIVASSEQALLKLLQEWGPHAQEWRLCSAFKCDVEDSQNILAARAAVLQEAGGLYDYFSQRLGHAPYTLLKLNDGTLDDDRRRRIAEDFLRQPEHCGSLCCRRIKHLCPTVPAVLANAGLIMKAVSDGSNISGLQIPSTSATNWPPCVALASRTRRTSRCSSPCATRP